MIINLNKIFLYYQQYQTNKDRYTKRQAGVIKYGYYYRRHYKTGIVSQTTTIILNYKSHVLALCSKLIIRKKGNFMYLFVV